MWGMNAKWASSLILKLIDHSRSRKIRLGYVEFSDKVRVLSGVTPYLDELAEDEAQASKAPPPPPPVSGVAPDGTYWKDAFGGSDALLFPNQSR